MIALPDRMCSPYINWIAPLALQVTDVSLLMVTETTGDGPSTLG
jgi:hypothetical protein